MWARGCATSLCSCSSCSSSPRCTNMNGVSVQFIGRVLDNPVTSQRQVRTVLTCADYWRLHRCGAWDDAMLPNSPRCLVRPWVQRPVPDGPDSSRRQWQWQVHGWFCWVFASLAPFVCRPDRDATHHGRLGRVDVYGGFWKNFFVKVNPGPEVDHLDIISTSSIWQFIRQLQRLLE